MTTPTAILIVEDEPRIRTGLKDFLEFFRFEVHEAADGLAAARLVQQRRFDLILLDLMLPGVSGEDLCRRWRCAGLTTPIIMLTAKGQPAQRVAGLDLGADDYLTKPFALEELRARIDAVLRRSDPRRRVAQCFAFGPWRVDRERLRVARDGTEHPLTPREAALLQYFAANPRRVIGRAELYQAVWGEPMSELGTRTVDMHIAKLRQKVEPDPAAPCLIVTVRGAGYQYVPLETQAE